MIWSTAISIARTAALIGGAALVVSSVPGPPAVWGQGTPGDLNCDGAVSAADLEVLSAILFGDPGGCEAADVNGD
ncbi:MAG TPA: dockerin type I domain-containing protein, partial [Terriglobales bacterium]|nr:dockerin type I domain-containing protein [Terriglobales bacterium]